MRIKTEETLFVMIDIQEKFESVIFELDKVINNSSILNEASYLLELPLIITEQYPRGLGHTIKSIHIPENTPIFEKKKFSIFNEEISNYIKDKNINTIVLYGTETHVCLMQSALDAKELGYNVVVVGDAVSSRCEVNRKLALKRFIQNDITIASTEMILFELMQSASHPMFRQISKLVK